MEKSSSELIEHLKLIQNVIGRMAENSSRIKGWAVSTSLAIDAFAILHKNNGIAKLTYLPVFIFAVLDFNYLKQEKNYRSLYTIALKNPNNVTFDLSTNHLDKSTKLKNLIEAIKSWSIYLFYVPLLVGAVCVNFIKLN